MDDKKLKNILEAGLLVAGRTLSLAQLEALFQHEEDTEKPDRKRIRAALDSLKEDYEGRGIELVEVASGFRLQSHESVADWVANLFQEKTPRYSRALLETLVLIAYRQPITRAEIEEVRGVAVSSNIIKTLQERQWVKVLGHKDVPGKPALLGTTKDFLDYFNLKKLDDLPELAEIKDLDQFDEMLADEVGEVGAQGEAANDDGTNDDGNNNDDGGAGGGADESSDAQANDDNLTNDESSEDAGSAEQQSGNDLDSQADAMLDLGADDQATDADSAPPSIWPVKEASDDSVSEEEREVSDIDNADGPEEHNETLTGPELDLLRVIADFSEEHQQEVDARDEMEAKILSKNDDELDEADISDLSQRIGDDKTIDGPEPGDTLH